MPTSPFDRPEDVLRRTAELARLELSEEELGALAPGFARILGAFEALSRWPLEDAPATSPAPRSRPDEPRPSLDRGALLARAPEPLDGFFGVPKTVGGEG